MKQDLGYGALFVVGIISIWSVGSRAHGVFSEWGGLLNTGGGTFGNSVVETTPPV